MLQNYTLIVLKHCYVFELSLWVFFIKKKKKSTANSLFLVSVVRLRKEEKKTVFFFSKVLKWNMLFEGFCPGLWGL